MRRLLALAFATLTACGGTLYTSEGLPALPVTGNQCLATQMSCDLGQGLVCAEHDVVHCASCTDACPADPQNGQQQCLESALGAADWACHLRCSPGWLRTGASCSRTVAVAAGDAHACAIAGGGLLKCWGANGAGQVTGAPTSGSVLLPHDLASGASLVAAGRASTCAVVGGAVSCWGTVASPSPAVTTASGLAVGASHACALLSSGAIQCWGTGPAAAQAPAGTAWVALSSGTSHACALDSGGAVTCWGQNDQLQLGGGAASATSRVVFPSGIAALGAGGDQACAAALAGTRSLQCWGNGAAPAQVARVTFDAVEIAPGRAHVCARRAGEAPKCFGDNAFGQLGQAGVLAGELGSPPGPVGDYRLAAGRDHTCALFPDGSAQCWGDNAAGQLGDGTTVRPPTGTLVSVSGR